MRVKDTYKEVKVIKCGENVARVYIPDISAEERTRRLAEIGRLAGEMLASKTK